MEQFEFELNAAIQKARTDVTEADAAGDDTGRIIHLGRLEDLQRLAVAHGLAT